MRHFFQIHGFDWPHERHGRFTMIEIFEEGRQSDARYRAARPSRSAETRFAEVNACRVAPQGPRGAPCVSTGNKKD